MGDHCGLRRWRGARLRRDLHEMKPWRRGVTEAAASASSRTSSAGTFTMAVVDAGVARGEQHEQEQKQMRQQG